MKYIAFLIGIIAVIASYFGYQYTQSTEMAVGAPFSQFISTQLASSPVAGYVLSTDGFVNSWIPDVGGSGGSGGSNWTVMSGGLRTSTTTDFARAAYFVATSTTGTSTFAGDITMQHNKWLITHGIRGDASDGLYITSNNGTNVADFGIGNTANSSFFGGVNIDGTTRIATTTNGVLQATAGTVSATTTGNLTETATGLEFSATRALIGGSSILSLTTGYGIPLTASTTNWNGFYDTPSTRITAGNGLAWTGNTLSATNTHNPVTLAGEDYLSLSTQLITANAIDPDNLSASDFGSFTCNGTTCAVDNGAISNAMLANSSVSYGGISLALGATDATPAFNLADATGLPISTGVSGLGTGVASFLATPSSANLRTAVTDETGSGALVFGTSPTLTTFFGTPCTGNTFLQDISDTGSFTCTEATGSGGGGGSLSTTTDIIGVPTNTPELVSYVTGDVMFGGSASTTAEFQFDDDGSQFIISSSSANATGTILTNNNAQALRFGDDDGDMIEMYFGTAGDIILRALGTITDWVFNMNLYVQTGKNIFLGAVQWNSGDNIDGEAIANDTIDDDSIDLVDVTLADFTNDAGFITNDTSVDLTAHVTGILPQANGGTGTTTQLVWSRTIASTSIEFINGSLMPLTLRLDGGTITKIVCKVDGGTSKIIAIEDASGNSSEDITCGTTPTADDGSITNATYTSLEEMYIDFGATSGTVDHVSISVYK